MTAPATAAKVAAASLLLMAQAPATPPASTPPPQDRPAQQELLYNGEAASILGRTVRGPNDKPIGRIVDLLVDDAGQPRAAVVDVGGFMGMGSRQLAVAWRGLRFLSGPGHPASIVLDMTLDQIKGTPDYKRPASGSSTPAPPVTVAAPHPPTPLPAPPQ